MSRDWSRGGTFGSRAAAEERPLAHPPEPGYPCYVSVLGELAWMAPREEPREVYPVAAGVASAWESAQFSAAGVLLGTIREHDRGN
jgi:hypothetical protein